MRTNDTLALLTLVCLAAPATAQPTHLAQGQIVAAKGGELRVMEAGGLDSINFTPPLGISTILWDPAHPDQLITGGGPTHYFGDGYLQRVTFTSATQVSWSLLTPKGHMAGPRQLSWDQSGKNIIVVTGQNQVKRIDATTGAVSAITSGGQPWGQANCGRMDPLTGDIYIGTPVGDLWRIPSGGSSATLVLGGLGDIQDILIDSTAQPHHLYTMAWNALRRIDLSKAPVAESFFGGFSQPQSSGWTDVEFDLQGNLMLANFNNDSVYTLPNVATIPSAGIAPTVLGQYAGQHFNDLVEIAVVGGTDKPFRLTFAPVPVLGVHLELENVPQPLGLGWIFLTQSTFHEQGSAPFFGIFPDALTISIMNLNPTPGGVLAFYGIPPQPLTAPPLTMLPFFGQTWDGVAVAFSPSGKLLGRSNVVRSTWQ